MVWDFWIVLLVGLISSVAIAVERDLIQSRTPISLPVNIKVALLGFQRDGGFDFQVKSSELHDILQQQFNLRAPLIRGRQRNEKAGILYNLEYEVVHMPRETLENLEKLMRENLGSTPQVDSLTLEIESIHPFYVDLLGKIQGEHSNLKNYFTIFLVNPNKRRLAPSDPTISPDSNFLLYHQSNFSYTYKFRNGQATAQNWVGASKFCIVDLGAHPVSIGSLPDLQTSKKRGSTFSSYHSLPNFERMLENSKVPSTSALQESIHIFYSDVVKLVQSAVSQVFLPDVGFETNLRAQRIIIPLLFLRNHNLYHPFTTNEGDQDFSINLGEIEAEIRKMLLPDQRVTLIKGVHFLHDHPRVALALQKSIKAKADPFMNNGRHEQFQMIDSETLFHQLGHSDDVFAAGLFGSSHDSDQILGPSQTIGAEFDKLEKIGDTDSNFLKEISKKMKESRSIGARVLPVYIFSLADRHTHLTIDGETLVKGTKNGVVVLQTPHSGVHIPFFQGNMTISLNARRVTQHIIAGLAASLGGIESPLSRATGESSHPEEDFTWAIGYHPFGPFATSHQISTALTSLVIRNHIISRIHEASDIIEESKQKVTNFLSGLLNVKPRLVGEAFFRQTLFSLSLSGFPIHRLKKFEEIEKSSSNLVDGFREVSKLLQEAELRKAEQQSVLIFNAATRFREFVADELREAQKDLQCCVVTPGDALQSPPSSSSSFVDHLYFIFQLTLAVMLVWVIWRK